MKTTIALLLLLSSTSGHAQVNVTGTWQPSNWTLKLSLHQNGKVVYGYGGAKDFWFRGAWNGPRLVLVATNLSAKRAKCVPRGIFVLTGSTVERLNALWKQSDSGRTLSGAWVRQAPSAGEQVEYPYADELKLCGSLRTYDLTFKSNSEQLDSAESPLLNAVAQLMKTDPDAKIEILGHTDSVGDEAKNKDLSQRRAESVKRVLVGLGADAARITATGAGEDQPVAPNTTEDGKALNRRVEIVLGR